MSVTQGFHPFWAFVLLERESIQKTTSLIIPETAEKRNAPAEGIIIAVGKTADDDIKRLKGQKVLFKKNSGDWIKIDGVERFICHEEDILGAWCIES